MGSLGLRSSSKSKLNSPSKSEFSSFRQLSMAAPKSAMKPPGAPSRRRGGKGVRFKGMVSPALGALVARCVTYTRAGSSAAGWWEAFMAVLVTADFLCIPLSLVSQAFTHAHKQYETLHSTKTKFNFTYILVAMDGMFFINILYRISQARSLLRCCGQSRAASRFESTLHGAHRITHAYHPVQLHTLHALGPRLVPLAC